MTSTEPILHVDMDAFYASVEQRDLGLRGRPVAVGGRGPRGVVAAASYEARTFGVRSAMPMRTARRQCPQLLVVPPRMEHYRDVSDQLMAMFEQVTPLVEPLSLDEAFMDVSGARRLFGQPVQIAHRLRARIADEMDLTCSIGVASTKSVAKLLSALAKPDGLLHWPVEQVEERLRPLPARALWGIGPKTAERLDRAGLRTVGQIADSDEAALARLVGRGVARKVQALARGRDPRPVTVTAPSRSVSVERTFMQDIVTSDDLEREAVRLAERLSGRLRAQQTTGRTVTLKLRYASFETFTRSRTLDEPVSSSHDLSNVVLSLLARQRLREPVRLLGIGVSNLVGADARQLSLGQDLRWGQLDELTDRVAAVGARIERAALLDQTTGRNRPTTGPMRERR